MNPMSWTPRELRHSFVSLLSDGGVSLADIAEIFRREQPGEKGYRIRDAGSLNGTYVNRDLVDECLLKPGDEVQIGKYRLVFYGSPKGVE
jgi:pSer/pThr/pTyr-binding forkhead associated (FHA) protein